jgi:hypothetical protein
VQRLLRAVDRSTARGLRDYALLLLMSTYGLGAGETIRLQFDDIDWVAGTILAMRAAEFDRIFTGKTGFVTLDRLLARLHANKAELLKVLDRPEIPLHTNGSENDIRCHVIRIRSQAAPAATAVAILATPSSPSPRPAPNSESAFGITSAHGSPSQAAPSSRRFPS